MNRAVATEGDDEFLSGVAGEVRRLSGAGGNLYFRVVAARL